MIAFRDGDPDGNGNNFDSDFISVLFSEFGVYYNLPGGVDNLILPNWFTLPEISTITGKTYIPFPSALKFTFTIEDSVGLIEQRINGRKTRGKTFAHIVSLDN